MIRSDNMVEYPVKRDLDGIYFRVKRGDKYHAICFSDLTKEEREAVLTGRNPEWVKNLALILADVIRTIGDEFDIIKQYNNQED